MPTTDLICSPCADIWGTANVSLKLMFRFSFANVLIASRKLEMIHAAATAFDGNQRSAIELRGICGIHLPRNGFLCQEITHRQHGAGICRQLSFTRGFNRVTARLTFTSTVLTVSMREPNR